MNVYKLEAAIGLNSTEYQKGLKSAGESMAAMGDKIKSGAATMAKVSAAAFTAITGAATATTAAVLKGVDAYTSYGDSVDKMSQKLNMSATAYQEWSAIMEHSGTSIDSMQASMKTLANAVETGNDAFERLGISQEEIASMNNEQLFSRTISALQNVGNETERTYLAGQLLGRGATELGALLNTSAEDTEKMRQRVHELGGVMSDEAVKASAKYRDSLQDMKTAFVGMGRGLITDFVPALTEVSDGLAAIFSGEENGAERFLKGFDSAMTTLSTSASRIKPIVKKIGSIAVQVVPEIIGTVGEKLLDSIPSLLGAGENILAKIAESVESANFNGGGIFGKILDSITSSSANYFEYGEKILANIGNSILNADYAKLGKSLSTIFTNALNSISNLLADLDMNKVGSNIADFIKAIDWKGIAESVVDLLGSAIGSLGDIAAGFFENMDGDTLFMAIGVLGAPKLLGGLNNFIGSGEGQSLGQAAGSSWSGAFMAGVKAFGLGWAIGSYLRDNVVIGDKTLGEWVDVGTEKTFDAIADNDILNKTQAGSALKKLKDEANSDEAETFTTVDGREALLFNDDGTLSNAYKMNAEKIAERNTEAWTRYATSKAAEESRKKGWEAFRKYNYVGPVKPENNAIGNYITQPTLTWAAEKEPEYIIPESKMDKVFSREGVTININVSGADLVASDTVAQKIAETLANLSIRQQRAVGGTAW